MDFFKKYLTEIIYSIQKIDFSELEKAAILINETSNKGKKIIIVGNGGSAAIASHVAVDFTKAAKVRAINFNEPDLITCFANDYGYENWVSEALNSYSDKGDLVILISSSGSSMNIVNAAKKSMELDNKVITFSGFSHNNPLKGMGDINFWVDSENYNYIEMSHHIWLVAICDYIISINK
jgi:D-sedoheptulose 7-phosphate isomerase